MYKRQKENGAKEDYPDGVLGSVPVDAGATEFPAYEEWEEEAYDDEDDYDSEGGALVPLAPEDLDNVHEEDDLRWAPANYQEERKARKAKGKGKGKGRGRGKKVKAKADGAEESTRKLDRLSLKAVWLEAGNRI